MSLFYTWVLLCYPDPNVPISYDIRYGELTWEGVRREITKKAQWVFFPSVACHLVWI